MIASKPAYPCHSWPAHAILPKHTPIWSTYLFSLPNNGFSWLYNCQIETVERRFVYGAYRAEIRDFECLKNLCHICYYNHYDEEDHESWNYIRDYLGFSNLSHFCINDTLCMAPHCHLVTNCFCFTPTTKQSLQDWNEIMR